MQAIIISAGAGTRLLPLTRALPKCLVPVDGRAILDRQLDALAAAGVTRATVVGGYRVEQLVAHLRRAAPAVPTDLVFNPFWSIASSIGSVWAARDRLGAPFMLMNGDTLFDASILAHALAAAGPGVSLLAEAVAAPALDDMLVRVANGRVLDVRKDLPDPTHRSLGVVLSASGSAYADALADVIGADGGPQAYHHAIVAKLARTGAVRAIAPPAGARWQEIDRPEDIGAWSRPDRGAAAAS